MKNFNDAGDGNTTQHKNTLDNHFEKKGKVKYVKQAKGPNPTDNKKAIENVWKRTMELASNLKLIFEVMSDAGIFDKEEQPDQSVMYKINFDRIEKFKTFLRSDEDGNLQTN